MTGLKYPTVDELIELNRRVLREIKAKKADRHRVLSPTALESLLRRVMEQEGDAYEKAVTLLTGLVRIHHFASGNRRTAYLAAKCFLEMNGEKIAVAHDPKMLQGIREGFYTRNEIIAWLKGHEPREFRRR